MISVIVCSIHPDKLRLMAQSLEATIGVSYELIVHDNRENSRGICEVYNMLAARAQYDLLCFVHEDVEFSTPAWGERLAAMASRPDTGCIGLAGGQYVGRKFVSWGDTPGFDHWNIWQRDGEQFKHLQHNPDADEYTPSVSLDGVLLFVRKEVWREVRFSQELNGFHLYDADFSVTVARTLRNYVCQWLELKHWSAGNVHSISYYGNLLAFQAKHKNHLPVACGKAAATGRWWKYRYEAEHAKMLFDRLLAFYGKRASFRYALAGLSFVEALLFIRYLSTYVLHKLSKRGGDQ